MCSCHVMGENRSPSALCHVDVQKLYTRRGGPNSDMISLISELAPMPDALSQASVQQRLAFSCRPICCTV